MSAVLIIVIIVIIMLCEVWYARIHKGNRKTPLFMKLNKKHVMSLARIKKIMKWYFDKYGVILDISYKQLSKTKNKQNEG